MRAAQMGLPQFALSAAEDAQAASPDRARWLAWEVVRWDLLYQLKRWPELQQLAQTPPADMPEAMRHHAVWRSAQALVALRHDAEARELLARLIWQGGLDALQMREARRLVIETLFSRGRGDDAYLAILRYQQDYHPLTRGESEFFAQGLSIQGRNAEALAWLPQVSDHSLALWLRLRGGLVQTQDALTQARSELKKGGGAGYWAVLRQAAIWRQDEALQVEALENLLSFPQENMPAAFRASTEDLWKSYHTLALALGNQAQLLQGDEQAWLDLAAKLEQAPDGQKNLLAARALLAHLARQSENQQVRQEAETRLFGRLVRAGLAGTAFRQFAGHDSLPLMLLADPSWLDDVAARRSVLRELALREGQNEEYERAMAYLLQLLDPQP